MFNRMLHWLRDSASAVGRGVADRITVLRCNASRIWRLIPRRRVWLLACAAAVILTLVAEPWSLRDKLCAALRPASKPATRQQAQNLETVMVLVGGTLERVVHSLGEVETGVQEVYALIEQERGPRKEVEQGGLECLQDFVRFSDPEARSLVKEALTLAQRREYDSACNVLHRVLESDLSLNQRAAVHLLMARTLFVMDDYDGALAHCDKALASATASGDNHILQAALSATGIVHEAKGEVGRALDFHSRALALSRELSDVQAEATNLANIGVVYSHKGDVERARGLYEEALNIARGSSSRRLEGPVLAAIGSLCFREGALDEAATFWDQGLQLARAETDRQLEADFLSLIAAVHLLQGHPDEAIKYFEEALAIHREVDDRARQADTLCNIGTAHLMKGETDAALENYGAALAVSAEFGDRRLESSILCNIGSVRLQQGDVDVALRHYEEALVASSEVEDRRLEASILCNIGVAYEEDGEFEKARQALQAALKASQDIGETQLVQQTARILERGHSALARQP